MRKKTVVIFGVSSFVGSNLAYFLKDHFRVIGTYNKNRVEIPNALCVRCDVLQRDEVQFVVHTFQPDFTVYAVGLTSVVDCDKHPKYADALNTIGVFNVTEYSERYKSKTVLLSTALVFNGEEGEHLENDSPAPNTIYGKTKAATEFFIQKSCLNYLIFRCCRFYGHSVNSRTSTFFESIQKKLFADKKVSLDTLVHEGFLDITYLGMILKLAFEQDIANRMFQISSKDIVTMYEFGKIYAKTFGESETLIAKGTWRRPHLEGYASIANGNWFQLEVSNIENFLNIELPTVEESLKFTYERLGGNLTGTGRGPKATGIPYI